MRLPLSLIKNFLEIDESIEKIQEALTLLGIEVDGVEHKEPAFSKVISAKILKREPHPQADKLSIALVTDGQKEYTVVCGAPNCKEGMITAYAQVGATLKDEKETERKIEKATLRGVFSEGMLCSEKELQLSEEFEGIMDLPQEISLGIDLASYFWDPVFELSLTPNLGHCLSAEGIARELSAFFQIPLKTSLHTPISTAGSMNEKIQVEIKSPNECPLYMGRIIEGVEVVPSPFWLQRQLRLLGMKPINNVVDITNYILMKRGQPLHAFDLDLIEGKKIEVKKAPKPFSFIGLDSIEREVSENTLVISDQKKVLALAGVLGSDDSAVSTSTKNIFLEAAFFLPKAVRSSSKKLGIRTESALRFEKGIDPHKTEDALNEAIDWILKTCGGKLREGQIKLSQKEFSPKKISLRVQNTNRILGTKLSFSEVEEVMHRLQFKTKKEPLDTLSVTVPYYRFDIEEEIDLIEEVARIYGYNNLEKTKPLFTTSNISHDPAFVFENELRERLVSLGLQEFLTSNLIGPKLKLFTQEILSPDVTLLEAIRAKTEEYSILRPSLLPGLMQVTKHNFDRKNFSIQAFEIGRIHFQQKEKIVEIPMAALLLSGSERPKHWSEKESPVDFFELKGKIETLLSSLQITEHSFQPSKHLSFHPFRQADIFFGELLIGSFGEIHPLLLNKFGIEKKVFFAELDMEHLLKFQVKKRKMTPLPSFPSSERDWTFEIGSHQILSPILKKIDLFQSPILEKVELIDLYHPEDKETKNATLRFTYRDRLKTISYEEVEKEHEKILSELEPIVNS